jgi:hypothetical protein
MKYKLPKGAKPTKRTATIGNWVKMEFDARLPHRGIVWYRVSGGFGHRNDREDWVADIPYGCLSVSDYNWKKGVSTVFRDPYKSFFAALEGESKTFLSGLAQDKAETNIKLKAIKKTIGIIQSTLV